MIFSREVLQRRRDTLMKRMGESSVGVWVGSPELIRSRDSSFRYRPSSDILYLTGFEEPEVVLVLKPDESEGNQFTMFVRPRNEEREIWEGRRLGPERAKEQLGADQVFSIDELEEKLPSLLADSETFYYQMGLYPDWDTRMLSLLRIAQRQARFGKKVPRTIVEPGTLVHEMRLLKTPEEVEFMRKACEITAQAHKRIMSVTRPGVMEYQLEALLQYHFRVNGCTEAAYNSIVGGGANAAILHYVENQDMLRDGDIVLIDAGAEYAYYAGDITRSFPVNGKFSPQQRDIYQLVLEAEEAAIAVCAPGVRFREIHATASRRLTEGLVELGLLEGKVDELVSETAYKPYYMHKTGHWLGIDVHDVGEYFEYDGSSRILKSGMVLTVEPGLYFHTEYCKDPAAEPFLGIGIRIEDDVLITDKGHEILTASAPKSIEDIEAIVGTEDLP